LTRGENAASKKNKKVSEVKRHKMDQATIVFEGGKGQQPARTLKGEKVNQSDCGFHEKKRRIKADKNGASRGETYCRCLQKLTIPVINTVQKWNGSTTHQVQ